MDEFCIKKHREKNRNYYHIWKSKGYCRIGMWCPVEIRDEIIEIINMKSQIAIEKRRMFILNDQS